MAGLRFPTLFGTVLVLSGLALLVGVYQERGPWFSGPKPAKKQQGKPGGFGKDSKGYPSSASKPQGKGKKKSGPSPVKNFQSQFLTFQYGNIPLILTAPHGGGEEQGGERDCGIENFPGSCRGGGCSRARDRRTRRITLDVAEKMASLCGRPYVVVADLNRKFVDFNRDAYFPEETHLCAFQDSSLKVHYDSFYSQIQSFISLIENQQPACSLLVDIHGTGKDKFRKTVVFGTGGTPGQTLPNLKDRDSNLGLVYGEDGLAGVLSEEGEGIDLEVEPPSLNSHCSDLCGGYIVKRFSGTYSERNGPYIDSVQWEIGSALRDDEEIDSLTQAMAQSLCQALENHGCITEPLASGVRPAFSLSAPAFSENPVPADPSDPIDAIELQLDNFED